MENSKNPSIIELSVSTSHPRHTSHKAFEIVKWDGLQSCAVSNLQIQFFWRASFFRMWELHLKLAPSEFSSSTLFTFLLLNFPSCIFPQSLTLRHSLEYKLGNFHYEMGVVSTSRVHGGPHMNIIQRLRVYLDYNLEKLEHV